MRRKKSSAYAVGAALICLTVAFLIAAGALARLLLGYRAGALEYEDLAGQTKRVFLPALEREDGLGTENAGPGDGGETDRTGDSFVEVVSKDSLEELAKRNPDIAAWLEIPGIGLSYPVVRGEDNVYYLEHTFGKKRNASGTLFIESSQKGNFKEPNTILYGHHRKDGSMFGRLDKFRDKSCFEKNPEIFVTTEDGVYQYNIFSCYAARYDSGAYTLFSGFGPEYAAYLKEALKASLHAAQTLPKAGKPILTLSTCEGGQKEMRFIVHAALCGKLAGS